MMPTILQERLLVPQTLKVLPNITLIVPFEPKISGKADIDRRLEHAEYKVATELARHYSREEAYPVLSRLRKLINGLNFSTYKKSIAIFVSSKDKQHFI